MKPSWRPNPLEGGSADQCVWCGGDDVTGEHLISGWILKNFELPVGTSFDKIQIERANYQFAKYIQSLATSHVKSKVVCRKKCNGGWMSLLESEVKPFLKPMSEGKEVNLTDLNLNTLSIWASVKAICADYREPCKRRGNLAPDGVSSKNARAKIFERQIPSRFQIGVAACDYPRFSVESFPYQIRGKDSVVSYKPIVFRIGFLVVLVNLWTGGFYAPSERNGFVSDDSFLVTHPSSGGRQSWPPKRVLTSTELNSLIPQKLLLPPVYEASIVDRVKPESPFTLPISGETKKWWELASL